MPPGTLMAGALLRRRLAYPHAAIRALSAAAP